MQDDARGRGSPQPVGVAGLGRLRADAPEFLRALAAVDEASRQAIGRSLGARRLEQADLLRLERTILRDLAEAKALRSRLIDAAAEAEVIARVEDHCALLIGASEEVARRIAAEGPETAGLPDRGEFSEVGRSPRTPAGWWLLPATLLGLVLLGGAVAALAGLAL